MLKIAYLKLYACVLFIFPEWSGIQWFKTKELRSCKQVLLLNVHFQTNVFLLDIGHLLSHAQSILGETICSERWLPCQWSTVELHLFLLQFHTASHLEESGQWGSHWCSHSLPKSGWHQGKPDGRNIWDHQFGGWRYLSALFSTVQNDPGTVLVWEVASVSCPTDTIGVRPRKVYRWDMFETYIFAKC